MQKLNLTQNTDEWLEARKRYRTASEAAIVLGISPWTSKEDFKLIRAGLKKQFYSKAMRQGHELEQKVRDMASEALQRNFVEACYARGDYMASLDGLDDNVLVELKVSEYTFNDLLDGHIPEYYMSQVQQQLYCSPATVGYLVAYSKDYDQIAISAPIIEDSTWMARIEAAWEVFDAMPLPKTPIDMSDDGQVTEMFNEYAALKRIADDAKKEMDKVKKQIIALAPDNGVTAGDYGLTRSVVHGHDYKQACEDAGLALDDYEKESIRYTITVPKSPFEVIE